MFRQLLSLERIWTNCQLHAWSLVFGDGVVYSRTEISALEDPLSKSNIVYGFSLLLWHSRC